MIEVHLELLLGRTVHAPDGRPAGRIEEVLAVPTPDGCRVVELHLGPEALLERLSLTLADFPGLGWLRRGAQGLRVPWERIDLSDPDRPRLTCAPEELERLP